MNNTPHWIKNVPRNEILNRINKIKKIDSDGKLSFGGFEFDTLLQLLVTSIITSEEVPDIEKTNIIQTSIFDVVRHKELTSKLFLRKIAENQKSFLMKPKKKFILASDISISKSTILKLTRINQSTIIIKPFLKGLIKKTRNNIIENPINKFVCNPPSGYQSIRIFVEERTQYAAFYKALNALNLIRGIWNLYLLRGRSRFSLGGQFKPVNKIILGPIHTMHNSNGDTEGNNFWYEKTYQQSKSPYNISQYINNIYKFEKYIRRKLNKHSYKKFIESAIIQYVEALDHFDEYVTWIRLWGILEYLTLSHKSDLIIKRTTFLLKTQKYHIETLRILRSLRNLTIHSNYFSYQMERPIYQLKFYVEILLEFHINNRYNFKNETDCIAFLDLPPNASIMKNEITKLKSALNLYGEN